MRRALVVVTLVASFTAMVGFQPAAATHGCTNTNCNPIAVALLQGQGRVCAASGLGSCSYHHDAFWPAGNPLNVAQGLYCPTRGPGAGSWGANQPNQVPPFKNLNAPFRFTAGPGVGVLNACFSNIGGTGCAFVSQGNLAPGRESNLGAYAFSSSGEGQSTFTAPATPGNLATSTTANFYWSQSAATILPLRGEVISATIGGVPQPSNPRASVVGFTSSRSFQDGGNCGVTAGQPTTIFQVEGMVVTF